MIIQIQVKKGKKKKEKTNLIINNFQELRGQAMEECDQFKVNYSQQKS